jgi:uracil-DNA glycosylase family 4
MDEVTKVACKREMLLALKTACGSCVMCELGLKKASRDGKEMNPHVFSSMNYSRIIVVGQNPGWNEVLVGSPFVGEAGKTFDCEIAKHGLSRQDFYICNAVRCFTQYNTRPSPSHLDRCEPFLHMEINLIKPLLVVVLGAVAFERFCPTSVFSESLKKIVISPKYKVPVFAIYHPSALNLEDSARRVAFEDQIRIMCALVKALRQKY